MQGLDNVILTLSAAVRDGNGSRYPLVALISAKPGKIFSALDETVRGAFAKLQPVALAV